MLESCSSSFLEKHLYCCNSQFAVYDNFVFIVSMFYDVYALPAQLTSHTMPCKLGTSRILRLRNRAQTSSGYVNVQGHGA
jgi:hypothetical protein